ncbi:MAG: hypothetical protein WCF57_11940 [Pyrinomonadaceae bacterium]
MKKKIAKLNVAVERESVVRFGERFGVTFQRTLRVPDDGRVYSLPPGIGTFPVLRVEDYMERAPPAWRERGGVFIPLYQREALWLGFQAMDWKPNAVKVGVGGVNAVTGGPWGVALREDEADYMVSPPQLWLDGIKSGPGRIRQFVAAPLNQGLTVEAQVMGADTFGGIQIVVFEPRPGIFPDEAPPPPEIVPMGGPFGLGGMGAPPGAQAAPQELGIAAGGSIEQKIYPDPYGVETWDADNYGALWVHLVNSEQFRAITGRKPPATPITAKTYTEYGLPWFALYDEEAKDLPTHERLARVKSASRIEAERGAPSDPEDESVEVKEEQIMRLDPKKRTRRSRPAAAESAAGHAAKREKKKKPDARPGGRKRRRKGDPPSK